MTFRAELNWVSNRWEVRILSKKHDPELDHFYWVVNRVERFSSRIKAQKFANRFQ